MTLKGQINEEELKGLDPVLQGEYVKGADDMYYPDVAEINGWAFENVANLRKTKDDERKRREDWERKHGELKATIGDADPDELKSLPELKRQIEEMKKWTPDDKVRQRISELEDTYKTKLREAQDERTQEVSARDARIKRLVTSNEARRVLGKLECLDADLFLERIERNTVIDENDNVWPVDGNGDHLQTKEKGAVGDMTLEEYCSMLKKQHPRNFKGSKAAGGGGDPTAAGGGGGNNNKQLQGLGPTERLKALRRATGTTGT